jgi:flagellar biogenesis protein FliO
MSALAKLLQIQPTPKMPRADGQPTLSKIWKRFMELLRSAKVQRRVRRLEVVERVTLGNKQSVVLVRVDQREFVVGCCGESVVLLVAPPAEAAKVHQPKRKRKVKSKSARISPASATLSSTASEVTRTKLKRTAKAKTSKEITAPLKKRVPTKASLMKAFTGRIQ